MLSTKYNVWSNRICSLQQICFHVELFLKSSGNKKGSGYILLSKRGKGRKKKKEKQTDPAAGFLWFQCRRSAAEINEADFGFYRYQIITDAWENHCWEMFADYSDRVWRITFKKEAASDQGDWSLIRVEQSFLSSPERLNNWTFFQNSEINICLIHHWAALLRRSPRYKSCSHRWRWWRTREAAFRNYQTECWET